MKKQTTPWFFLLLASLFWSTCKKENFGDGWAEGVPLSVNLGETQIFLNGEFVEFKPNIVHHPSEPDIFLEFTHKRKGVNDVITFYSPFGAMPLSLLRADFDRCKNCEDDIFEFYEQVGKDTAFFEITGLDTGAKQIWGRFQANFQKNKDESKKLTFKAKYPDNILIQGVFNEHYIEF